MAYIKTPDNYNAKTPHISIATFVETELQTTEDTKEYLDKLATYCGWLTDQLVDKGILSIDEVGEYFFTSLKR